MFNFNTTIATNVANVANIEFEGLSLSITIGRHDMSVSAEALSAFVGADISAVAGVQDYINSELGGAESLEVEDTLVALGAVRERLYAINGHRLLNSTRLVIRRT